MQVRSTRDRVKRAVPRAGRRLAARADRERDHVRSLRRVLCRRRLRGRSSGSCARHRHRGAWSRCHSDRAGQCRPSPRTTCTRGRRRRWRAERASEKRFGRGICRRTEKLPCDRQVCIWNMGHAEIGELPHTALAFEDVGRFDVAVDDAAGVCGGERVRDLNAQRSHRGCVHLAVALHARAQRAAGGHLHHEVG